MAKTFTKHIVVVGAGAIGVSVATHLIRTGASVTLITEGEVCSGASGRSLSWLNSAGERSKPYHDLRMAGIDRYRTLLAQHSSLEWLSFGGGLRWGFGDEQTVINSHEYEKNRGYDSHLLTTAAVEKVDSGVSASTANTSVVYNPGEGWVSLPHLIAFLLEEFSASGGTLVEQAGKCHVITSYEGEATGVKTADGQVINADAVALCCGSKTSQTVAELGINIPDNSPVSMLVTTKSVETPRAHSVLNTPRAAMRPDPGQRFACDHDWYESDIEERADGSYHVDPQVPQQLIKEANKLLPSGTSLEVAYYKMGRKPIPGDGEPVIGELQQAPGCFVAFTHSGATLALLVGELLADEIITGQRNAMFEDFRPERFQTA